MTKPVVLIAEELSPATVDALGPDFEIRQCDGADRSQLLAAITDVDAILVRSATKVDEEALAAARREFAEEMGSPPPDGPLHELGEIRQRNGKIVTAWAIEAGFDVTTVVSNTFEMEWPPRSGRMQECPEIDAAEWFPLEVARVKLVKGQLPMLDALG